MAAQATLRSTALVEGVGLHSGEAVRVEIHPAPAGSGRWFRRGDCDGARALEATVANVTRCFNATTLGRGEGEVTTVEHLLAVLHACGVENAEVVVDGPELPALDGSARGWLEAIEAAGIAPQRVPAMAFRVLREVRVERGESWARFVPGDGLRLDITCSFDHPLIGETRWLGEVTPRSFAEELAGARTFCLEGEVEKLRAAGLAKGGGLHNAVVFGEAGVLNSEGLRWPDEPVRHKAMDVVGDLALLGHRLIGRYEAHRPGHALTVALLREALSAPDALEIVGL